ncbi:MBL fold metallo-hydrolase [Nocardia harenae]|uniref:MBL fold metallo-hydrolase n=1 Tax=Nocardia harenae TaxID=358707 RepID=UPI000836BC2C|nr:MBL fold metallo-hydrolase [Nocardia harenae]
MASRHARAAVARTAAAGVAAARSGRDVLSALGAAPKGDRAARISRSPQFRDGAFRNEVPVRMLSTAGALRTLPEFVAGGTARVPAGPIPVLTPVAAPSAPDGLYVTWYGHASALVELEGVRVLLDPVWSARCSPSALVGPRRLHRVPVPLRELPALDAVLISHDHYDHLDAATIRELLRLQAAPFVVPLGVGAHLEHWGVPAARIVELDWHESATVAGIRLTAAPARHNSGRGLSRDGTLWASWVLAGKRRRAFYTGDSGYFPGYAAIGETYGPFDLTLAQIGAYGDRWPDIHMTPEQAVTAHRELGGALLVPVHWATFDLALHGWAEPARRITKEAAAHRVRLAVPRPGELVDVGDPPAVDFWWEPLDRAAPGASAPR